MSLLHCFVVTKQMAVGGATSGILYNLFHEALIHTQHVTSTSMVVLITHQKLQGEQCHTIPDP